MSSSGDSRFLFTAVVANQSQKEKELSHASARSHAARVSHRSRTRWRAKPVAQVNVRFEHGKGSMQRAIKATRDSSSPTPSRRSHDTPPQDRGALPLKLGLPRPAPVDLNPYPIEKTAAVHTAMQYYTQVYARSKTFQLGSQTEAAKCLQMLFPCLVQDSLWFTATVASCLELSRRGLPESHALTVASLYYHRRATTELRHRISAADNCAADGVLMAIGQLIALNLLQGDMKAANSHVNGLKQLVGLRGGEESLLGFDGYVKERVIGQIKMWDLTQASLKIDPGPSEYPRHPFPPSLCRHMSKFPPGLEKLALSGSINIAIIRLLAGIVFYSSRILASTRERTADARKMLVFVYALSRQVRIAELNTIEQILVMVVVEACVLLGSTRNLHWVMIAFQQLRLSSLLSTKPMREVLKNLSTYQEAFTWMGAVLLATNTADSDAWRLGKELADEGNRMEWKDRIELCERYIWYDELSVRLAQKLEQ